MKIVQKIRRLLSTYKSRKIQDKYDLSYIKNSQNMIVFFNVAEDSVNGGIMSIVNFAEYSRKVLPSTVDVVICTLPDNFTVSKYTKFNNTSRILRFEQIYQNAHNLNTILIHIPEFVSGKFCSILSKIEADFLHSIPYLHINIMNQNIQLMPPPDSISNLYQLTDKITQTTAHERYTTQNIADNWGIPVHKILTYIDYSNYKKIPFERKEKLIVFSPDKNSYKEYIKNKLIKDLPEYKIQTVRRLTFESYMKLIAKAFCVLSFGEGFDGYFKQPASVGTVGFAVYNDDFFPNESWKFLPNVYKSYDELFLKIANDIKLLASNSIKYYQIIEINEKKQNELINQDIYINNIKRFYDEDYDFMPSKSLL